MCGPALFSDSLPLWMDGWMGAVLWRVQVFTGVEGWELAPYAKETLERLAEWKDNGDGPFLGVISNFDERLPKLLDALGIGHYFDICLTSKECGMEKPARQIFDIALAQLGIYDRSSVIHVGDSFDKDVVGATKAGWNAVYVRPPPYADLPPQSDDCQYAIAGDLGRLLDVFGVSTCDQCLFACLSLPNGSLTPRNLTTLACSLLTRIKFSSPRPRVGFTSKRRGSVREEEVCVSSFAEMLTPTPPPVLMSTNNKAGSRALSSCCT